MVKILVIDDEPGYRDLLYAMLLQEGYDVRAVANAQEALALVQHFVADLIVVDWMLRQDTDGLDLVHALRSVHPMVKTIMITGFPTASLEARVRGVPDCQFLAKPFTLRQLNERIRLALGPPPALEDPGCPPTKN